MSTATQFSLPATMPELESIMADPERNKKMLLQWLQSRADAPAELLAFMAVVHLEVKPQDESAYACQPYVVDQGWIETPGSRRAFLEYLLEEAQYQGDRLVRDRASFPPGKALKVSLQGGDDNPKLVFTQVDN